jgi:enediyne biosynthesis protein E4
MRAAVAIFAVFSLAALQHETGSFTFADVAASAGLNTKTVFGGETSKRYIVETTGGGVAFVDYDRDGWVDIFLVNGSRFEAGVNATNHLYRNNRDGTFTDVTKHAGLERSGWGQGVCAGDYDNDGHTDLFVTYWGRNVLYRNTGEGTFSDQTEASGLRASRERWGSGCAFFDYDRDGLLDLFVSNYIDFDLKTAPQPGSGPHCRYMGLAVNCGPRGLKGESNLLFHNEGGKFVDVSAKSGISKAREHYGLGVLVADFDNDEWPDVYVANDKTASLLFRNKHDGTFEEIGVYGGVAYDSDGKATSGMGVAAADFDRDGLLDILKTNFTDEATSLYRNSKEGLFVDESATFGLGVNRKWVGWGAGFADFDNDGWPDILIVNGHVFPELETAKASVPFRQPRVLYRNVGGKRFEDVSAKAGGVITTPRLGRGAAFGDFDNDGRVDVVINEMNGTPSLLRSTTTNQNHWVLVQLEGTKSNRSAIGARVICVAGGLRQMDEVRSGGSFFSQNHLRLHFGLGAAERIDLLEIRWPSGTVERIRDVGVDRILSVREGFGAIDRP